MGLLVRGILRHRVHKGRITDVVRSRLLTCSGLLEVETVAAAPLPGVVQVEHSHHITLAHLLKQVVQTSQYRIVIYARCDLQGRLHLRLHATLTVGAYEDTQIINALRLQQVEFLGEPLAVTALPFRAQDSPIPEVRTHIIIRFTVLHEMAILHSYERIDRLFHSLTAGSDYRRHHEHHEALNCNIYNFLYHAAKVQKIIESAKCFLKKMQRIRTMFPQTEFGSHFSHFSH